MQPLRPPPLLPPDAPEAPAGPAAPVEDALLAAIGELYRTDFARFVRVAAAITGDIESARDVVQDAFAKLIRHRAEHRADGSLGGWAWRAVVNTAHSERRARGYASQTVARLAALPEPAAGDDAPDTALRAALSALPERQRLIVFLRYYADLDYEAIAETLTVTVGTVGAALTAARTALRAAVVESTPADTARV